MPKQLVLMALHACLVLLPAVCSCLLCRQEQQARMQRHLVLLPAVSYSCSCMHICTYICTCIQAAGADGAACVPCAPACCVPRVAAAQDSR